MRWSFIVFLGLLQFQLSAQKQSLCYEITNPQLGTKTSYLFGTMHVMEESNFFFPKKISKLLKKSEALCLEVKDLAAVTIDPKLLFDTNFTLKQYCNSNQWDSLMNWASDILLLNPKQFENTFLNAKPFLFLQFILATDLPKKTKSHEIELENIAKGKNLKVLELEGVEAQLSIFDAIPIEGQVELIFNALYDLEQGKKNFIEMQKTYANQNLEEMCGFAIKGFLEEYSVWFLDQRNKKWIEKMEPIMLENATFFAVGAGHLCGKNGLLQLLEQKGYQIKVIYL